MVYMLTFGVYWWQNMVNATIYSIHGSYGSGYLWVQRNALPWSYNSQCGWSSGSILYIPNLYLYSVPGPYVSSFHTLPHSPTLLQLITVDLLVVGLMLSLKILGCHAFCIWGRSQGYELEVAALGMSPMFRKITATRETWRPSWLR